VHELDAAARRGRPWPSKAAARYDLLTAGAVLALQIGLSLLAAHNRADHVHPNPAEWALLVVGPLALLAWRRHPVVVLWTTVAVALGPAAAGYSYLSLIVAFFLAATTGHRRAAWSGLVVGYVAAMWVMPHVWAQSPTSSTDAIVAGAGLAFLAVLADAFRLQRERTAERHRAEEIEAHRRAGEERLRMARDLHDVIGHSVSLINVQAAVGLDLMDTQPEQARAALAAIKTVSKDALDELRAMLATLRQDSEKAPRSPAPGLDRVDELIEVTRAAGVPITLEAKGTAERLPAAVDLTAYRIVQEALTNVTRHAPGAAVRVRIEYQPGALVVEVIDSGGRPVKSIGGPASGQGTGIGGMKERAAALGGHLEAGPRRGGGFRVSAELPVEVDA
jgi:signal transduction histidine kinase